MKTWIIGRNPRRTLVRAGVLSVVTLIFAGLVVRPVKIQGQSMYPTYISGTFRAIFPAAFWWKDPQRGDVVAIRIRGARIYYLKRILGLPGERVAFDQGQLLINELPHPEPYLSDPGSWTIPSVQLAVDEYYVAGDNREVDWRHHTMGRVRRDQMARKAW